MYTSGHVEGVAPSARFDEPLVARRKGRPKEVRMNSRGGLDGVSEDERERRENGQGARHDLVGPGSNLLTEELYFASRSSWARGSLVQRALEKTRRGRLRPQRRNVRTRPKGQLEAVLRGHLYVGSAKATGGVAVMWEFDRRRWPCAR